MESNDPQLIQQTLAGRIQAFEDLVKRYQHVVYGLAFHLLQDFRDAQDVTQEVFLVAYESLDKLRDRSKFASWLRAITTHLSLMEFRKSKAEISLEELSEAGREPVRDLRGRQIPTPAEDYERTVLSEMVREAMEVLPESHRLCVTLYFINGLSYGEIGDFLDVPVNTVKGWMYRAKGKLREVLQMVEQEFSEQKLSARFTQRVVEQAVEREREEILTFLEKRGLAENAWLIGGVSSFFRSPDDYSHVIICRLGAELVGAAEVVDMGKRPAELRAGHTPRYDYWVRMGAEDLETLETLIEALPSDQLGSFSLHQPLIQEYFDELPDATCDRVILLFTVSHERLHPVGDEEVTELTPADMGLFEECERRDNVGLNWKHARKGSRLFAILRDGKAVTSTWAVSITPATATKRQVINIGGLYTETTYRRMGLAKRLLSYVTEIILQNGDVPLYFTDPEDIALHSLAKGLGYWQFGKEMTYFWRKPRTWKSSCTPKP